MKYPVQTFCSFLLPLFLLAAGACKKPILEVTESTVPPLVLTTSIGDSLPAKAISSLDLDGLTGIKIQHYSGLYCSYFEYNADKKLLLETISTLPFPLHAKYSDIICHRISTADLDMIRRGLSKIELESVPAFWDADLSNAEIFECVKPPFRHTLQIAKASNRILHRIELLEGS